MPSFRYLAASLLLCLSAVAQNGDKGGEEQKQPTFPIPPSPFLKAEESLKAFKVAPGFHVELVASEPLVEDPVNLVFDPDGRLWVVEMRGFMPDVDGHGEDQPIGRIVILEDTDGDGKMDKRTVFADGLVMPRAISLVRDGVLVGEPPNLWFMKDTNGDGKMDEKVAVAKDYGSQSSPEHTANGLVWGIDNWIYSANYTFRFRSLEDEWKRESTSSRGQWGISQDNYGRLFFNSNEDQLRCDLVPAAYLFRNPNLRSPSGLNVQVIKDQSVWPARVNPGVNRGYRPGQLRTNGTLATFTAACSPLVYRGDNFPSEYQGNVFVCEPSGNLIKRDILSEKDNLISARRAYEDSEFLASTDERFRPVSLQNAPDGTLYVVDMHHGIIQHRVYVTSYLRQQMLSRGLEQPLHSGRIYRVVHDGTPPAAKPLFSKASSAELVGLLSHPNGWWRDMAQRLLVERNNPSVVPALRSKAVSDPQELGRIHALWTLDGMGAMNKESLLENLGHARPKVRALAIRLAEGYFKGPHEAEFLARLAELARTDQDSNVQLQLAFSLGQLGGSADDTLLTIARNGVANPILRDAILSSLVVREVEFLQKLMADPEWKSEKPGRADLIAGLVRCVFAEHKPKRIGQVMELAANSRNLTEWQKLSILDGLASTAPASRRNPPTVPVRVIRLSAEPVGWSGLLASSESRIRSRAEKISSVITWPGQPGYEPAAPLAPLTETEATRFEAGKTLFATTCAQCHQPHGLGQEGLAPPLADSEWVLGSERRLVRIALQGAHGKLTVAGRSYNLDMPAFGAAYNDEQIASLLTYIRRAWDNTGNPIQPQTITRIRAETTNQQDSWTEAELLKVK